MFSILCFVCFFSTTTSFRHFPSHKSSKQTLGEQKSFTINSCITKQITSGNPTSSSTLLITLLHPSIRWTRPLTCPCTADVSLLCGSPRPIRQPRQRLATPALLTAAIRRRSPRTYLKRCRQTFGCTSCRFCGSPSFGLPCPL